MLPSLVTEKFKKLFLKNKPKRFSKWQAMKGAEKTPCYAEVFA